MKKLQTINFEFKNIRSYFNAYKILNLSFNFLDKELNYTTDTVTNDIDSLSISIKLSLTQTSEAYKLQELIDLFNILDYFADEPTKETEED